MHTQIVAIGDTHLQHTSRRNAARIQALEQILVEARQLPALGGVVWPGDLFHAKSSIEDRNTLARFVQAFAALAPVVIVQGNHDVEGDLDIFGALETTWPVHVVTTPQVIHIALATGGAARIACLPYPREAGLAAAGVAPGEVAPTASALLDTVFMQFAHELHHAAADGLVTLFVGHANVFGAVASTGQPLVGQEIALERGHLDRLSDVPKLLSHIHKAQDVSGATYIGSIAPGDWGETERKRYLVASFEGLIEEEPGGPRHWVLESRPLHVAPLYHVEGVLSRDRFEWVVKKGPDGEVDTTPASWRGSEVRVRYRFHASETGLLEQAKARILAEFADAAHLELEAVAVPDRAVRAPEVAAAKTTAEKLHAWCALSGVEASDGVLAKLAALETQEPTAVLAAVEQRMRELAQAQDAQVAA